MEHKILIGMLVGFCAVTILAVVSVYAFSVDLPRFMPFFKGTSAQATNETTTPIIITPPAQKEIIIPSPTATPSAAPKIAAQPSSSIKVEIPSLYSLVNAHRKEHGQSSLRVHPSLELSAKRKLEDMNANKYWHHENRDGVIDWSVFEQSGYHYTTAGENLSFGNNSAWSVFNAWVNSPEHNKQMLSPEYEDMGAAVDCENYVEAGEKKCAVVLHLGKQQ